MPITFRIDAAQRLGVIRCTGMLSIQDFHMLAAELRTHPEFGPNLRQLVFMDVTESTVKFMDWTNARVQLSGGARGRHIALVATTDFAFGVARQYAQSYGHDDQEIHVFREANSAATWLGVTLTHADLSA